MPLLLDVNLPRLTMPEATGPWTVPARPAPAPTPAGAPAFTDATALWLHPTGQFALHTVPGAASAVTGSWALHRDALISRPYLHLELPPPGLVPDVVPAAAALHAPPPPTIVRALITTRLRRSTDGTVRQRNHTYFNRRWTEFTGFTPAQSFNPGVWNQLLHPDDQAPTRQRWQHSLDTGAAYEIGRISGWFGPCTDIHEQKLARQRLEESEGRFRLMADSAPVLIRVSGLDKGRFYFNRPWLTYTGRTPEQEQGNDWTEGVHPEDIDCCRAIYTTAFDQRTPFQMEYRLHRAEDDYHWLLDTGVPRHDAAGGFQGYIGSCVDIEALKAAEDAVRTAYEDLETKVTFRNLELEREVRALRGRRSD